jgi:methylated-DNA-[protein]-cysteine S-methyltransferase
MEKTVREQKIARKYEKMQQLLLQIPTGKVTTYGTLAAQLDVSPRGIGRMLHQNKSLVAIPCHRVIKSDGNIGGYASGIESKKALLRSEGIVIVDDLVDLEKYGFWF